MPLGVRDAWDQLLAIFDTQVAQDILDKCASFPAHQLFFCDVDLAGASGTCDR